MWRALGTGAHVEVSRFSIMATVGGATPGRRARWTTPGFEFLGALNILRIPHPSDGLWSWENPNIFHVSQVVEKPLQSIHVIRRFLPEPSRVHMHTERGAVAVVMGVEIPLQNLNPSAGIRQGCTRIHHRSTHRSICVHEIDVWDDPKTRVCHLGALTNWTVLDRLIVQCVGVHRGVGELSSRPG